MNNKIVGIIPARYKSTRFPGKPLVKLLGKPMIIWVAELSSIALGKENIFIATEDKRIKDVVEKEGFNAIMTSNKHQTGTDRLAEVVKNLNSDIIINIQGDEPTVNPNVIKQVVNEKLRNKDKIINAMTKLGNGEDPNNINIPKVITNEQNELVYMSRTALPGYKNIKNKPEHYYKQVCIYAFNKEHLLTFNRYGRKSTLEYSEDIEILRFLELNIPIKMIEVEQNSYAVDIEEDIILVENQLKEIHNL